MSTTARPSGVSGVPLAPIVSRDRGEAFDTSNAANRPSSFKLRDLLLPHWKALLGGLFAVIGASIANLLDPWPLKVVIDNVLKPRHTHGWLNHLVLFVAGTDKFAILKVAALAALVIAVFGAFCDYMEKWLTTSVGQWVMHDMRRMFYSHIQKLSLAYHDHKQTGDLVSRATTDIDAIQSFITGGLLGALINVLTLTGMVVVMFYINWHFTLIALSVTPFLFAVVFTYTRRIKKASREVRKKESQIVSVLQETLSSVRVIRAFAREDYEQRRLEEESLESVEIALRARSLKAKLVPIVEVIVAIGTSMVLWFGALMVLRGTLSAGSLIVFVLYIGKMYKPMQELSKMTDSYTKAVVGYERIREVFETHGEVKDLPGARPAPRIRGKIEFDHVHFSYEPNAPVLHDVTFAIQPGQVAALVGPTGAGKSTIISLIPRFYDPASGVIKIDGTDIKRFKQKSLRQQMSFVLQDTMLFHGTIWNNIAYGKPEASRGEIVRAAELANAHEFIEKMPDKYNTIVGERGVTLSGGQRQRIAIARAIIRNTPILILDEPSSGLDAASEKLVFEALDNLIEGKTSIVIAHRLSTIRRADIIFVIQEGKIVESGKHEELLRSGGLYSQLYELQFNSEEDAMSLQLAP
jgi:ATP-binding cassette subfamily B protein